MTARRILQNFGSLTTAKMLGDGCTFLLFIVLARAFGQDGIGQYSFALAFTSFFALFGGFGLGVLSIKEMSRRSDSLVDYYSRIYTLRLILAVAVFSILLFILPFLPFPYETKLIIAVIGAYQVINTLVEGLAAIFVAREDMHLAGLLEFTLRAGIALTGITIVMAGGSLIIVLAALPVVTLGQLFVAYGMVTKKYGRPRLIASWSFFSTTLREAIPYGLSTLYFVLSLRVEVIFLFFFLSAAEVGIYNVAYRVVLFLLVPMMYIGVALLPLASRLYVNSRKELEALYHKSLGLLVLIGLPAAAGLWLIAPDLINLVFGKPFAESASILRFLALLLFLGCLRTVFETFLVSCDRQVERTKSQWTVALVNLLGNIILIPAFGIKGAAIARLISDTLLTILLGVRIRAFLGWPLIGSRLAMAAMATASFCLPFAFFSSVPLEVVIPASVLLYSGTLLLFKEIRRNEVVTLLSLVRSESKEQTSTYREVF